MIRRATPDEWASITEEACHLHLGISVNELRVRISENRLGDLNHVRLMRVLALMPDVAVGETVTAWGAS